MDLSGFGVYAIINCVTKTIYVGSTCRRFSHRKQHHWTVLGKGRHRNSRLQRAWNKYGRDAFEFVVLEAVTDPDAVVAREQHYLDLHFGKNCYNARPRAESSRGWCPGAETRKRMSAANKRRPPLSAEARASISAKAKGNHRNPWTPESRAKLAAARRGKPRGEAFREWSREESRRRCQDPEYVAKISAHFRDPAFIERHRQARQKSFAGVFVAPDGREFAGVVNLTEFCKAHGLTASAMSQVANGIRPRHKGWTYRNAPAV